MTVQPPIAIIAAAGDSPLAFAEKLRAQGRTVHIFAIEHSATADFKNFEIVRFPIGSIGLVISEMKKRECKELVFSGHLKRPPLHSIKPDMQGLKILAKVLTKGDDQALRIIKDTFIKEGINVIDPADIIPETYADKGVMCGQFPDDAIKVSIQTGVQFLQAATVFDVGQGCVVQGERILAMEGAEGTDALLKRAADLIDLDWGEPIFIKLMKANQDPSLDPPGFGLDTVKHCAKAKIKIIALEADRVVIFKKPEVIAEAERRGVSLIGIDTKDVLSNA